MQQTMENFSHLSFPSFPSMGWVGENKKPRRSVRVDARKGGDLKGETELDVSRER